MSSIVPSALALCVCRVYEHSLLLLLRTLPRHILVMSVSCYCSPVPLPDPDLMCLFRVSPWHPRLQVKATKVVG